MRGMALGLLALAGCSGQPAVEAMDMAPLWPYPMVGAETQRAGDPAKGYQALIDSGYINCGLPYSLYHSAFGDAQPAMRLAGRTGHNATLPYFYTATTAPSGVEVVAANCLTCHAGRIDGNLVVGLGAADRDFTVDQAQYVNFAGGLIQDPKEKLEWRRFADRVNATTDYVQMATVGVNPADNLTAALIAHHDAKTLAWSNTPLLDLPPAQVVPVDVPPWWRMKKKSAMFYSASGRGDHARIMMTAALLCVDDVAQARAIDAYFGDVRAWIASLEPPKWPHAVDGAQAEEGRLVFEKKCSRCHGTYGAGGFYPNQVVPLADVGTDDLLARGNSAYSAKYLDWFKNSFWGETSRIEPQEGYIAPPLDGIWATAPYLHNGSVPTIEALLDTKKRPKYWTRNFEDSKDYDPATLGWRFQTVDHGQADENDPAVRIRIYDTTLPGYGNGGHDFGDMLGDEDRARVIEYLKTL